MINAPVINSDHLRLRPHVLSDMDAFWAFYQTPRTRFMDRPETRTHLWYGLASEVGSWALMGMGSWAIEMNGELAGQVSLTQPPHFAEPELGYLLFDGFEGRGIAFDAASLALNYARTTLKPASLVSYIDSENLRSVTLATRLGATPDTTAKKHHSKDVVYRYRVTA